MYTFFITTTVYDALADLDDDSFSSIEGEMIIGQVDAITEKEAIKNFTSSIAMQNLKENYGKKIWKLLGYILFKTKEIIII